ncbi:MAG: hypothetical protein ABR549_13650 [Mycobacteriales bacterium]
MPKTVPTPLAAALGLVPTAIDTARRVPAKVVQLPVLAISTALSRWSEAQQRYDELAARGERFVAQVRGRSSELDEQEVEEWLAEPVPTENGEVSDPVTQVSDLLDQAARSKPQRHDTAATPDVVAVVEELADSVGGEPPARGELPLPDYDHMTLGSLRGRLRSLSVEELIAVRDYEKAHADRLPVITLLENRIAKLALGSDEPSPGGQLPVLPEAAGEGKVTGPGTTPAKRTTKKVRTT